MTSAMYIWAIDKVYIDEPCELLIRRSKDKLFAEIFFCNKEIPEPNRTANICVWKFQSLTMFLLDLFRKGSHVTRSFKTRKKITANVLEPHGPSMYTLSMIWARYAAFPKRRY